MSEKKIGEIRAELESKEVEELLDFIKIYQTDDRTGVQKLVEKAKKSLDKLEKEKERTYQLQAYEREYESYAYICGIDEAGRGPLAGPVVVAAVIMPEDSFIEGVNDSKKVSEKKREKLYDEITENAIAWSVGIIDQKEIDRINILTDSDIDG